MNPHRIDSITQICVVFSNIWETKTSYLPTQLNGKMCLHHAKCINKNMKYFIWNDKQSCTNNRAFCSVFHRGLCLRQLLWHFWEITWHLSSVLCYFKSEFNDVQLEFLVKLIFLHIQFKRDIKLKRSKCEFIKTPSHLWRFMKNTLCYSIDVYNRTINDFCSTI